MNQNNAAESRDVTLINVYCAKCEDDMYRVHTLPAGLPQFLRQHFDRHGEAYPHHLDFRDLDRFMASHDAPFEKSVSRFGSVELTARGPAANVLAKWLATSFASGYRPSGGGSSTAGGGDRDR